MTPPTLSIPEVSAPADGSWLHVVRDLRSRLLNWAQQVVTAFQGQILRQVDVTLSDPNTGTVSYQIDADIDGTPRALLIADGQCLRFVPAAPAVGEWTMVVGTGVTTVTLGTAATVAWFAFLVAR